MKKEGSDKKEAGITLIALVITIIVLLILAGVSIAALGGQNGILRNATEAKKKSEKGDAEDEIKLALNEWQIERYTGSKSIEEYLSEKFGGITDNEDGTYTIEKGGYKAQIDKDGNIIGEIEKAGPRPEIVSERIINEVGEEVDEGSQEVGTKLYIEIETKMEGGTIEKVESSEGKVEKVGEKYRIEINKNGKYILTITGKIESDEYSTKYIVRVKQYENTLKVGDYVKYEVTYTDVYVGYDFTAENGWRVLNPGIDNGDGTYTGLKLISTGIPAMLNYEYNSVKNEENNGEYGNWAGNAEQRERYANDYYASISNNSNNMYAAAGLRYNFEKIRFIEGTEANANEGCYIEVNGKTSGTLSETEFLSKEAEEVHNLTLAELNEARGESDFTSTVETKEKEGATGLFYLRALNKYNYNSSSKSNYWLASPTPSSNNNLKLVYYGGNINSNNLTTYGVRPVVFLSSDFQVEKTEG